MHISHGAFIILWLSLVFAIWKPADGRVAGKIGIYSNNYNGLCNERPDIDCYNILGRSTTGINEEIIWVSIGMGITIAILITIALCYILREKCNKRRDYHITA